MKRVSDLILRSGSGVRTSVPPAQAVTIAPSQSTLDQWFAKNPDLISSLQELKQITDESIKIAENYYKDLERLKYSLNTNHVIYPTHICF